ncbi:hypothetical protein ERICIV_00088 [Paenibacillus larvae subsp. larvae]|uniref:Uncharacterized protein n=1 Tax=Paenibacillus larvae subsp. larvae TaxID=147375 RepID=A0A2L1U863_9BACL|nr:hypothetical protein ERICIII_00088 [Paenibacillus larvae subsp. larvae]AVF29115.1 hypothetical protein ERICIV_00088 [Paenibacillus larvae subsp. larvae]
MFLQVGHTLFAKLGVPPVHKVWLIKEKTMK